MIKKLFLLAGLLTACAGAVDDEGFDESDDLGQVEQAFRGSNTPSFEYGTQTGVTRQKCTKTASGQVCAIPPSKTLSYCIHVGSTLGGPDGNSLTGAEHLRVRNLIESFDSMSDFTLNESAIGDCLGFPQQINVFRGGVGSSGTASNDIKDYAVANFGSFTSLTEDTGVVGSYVTWSACNMILDTTDIAAKGTNATQDNNGLDHAAGHTLFACLGIGGRSGDGGLTTRNLFNPATTAVNFTQGEACQLTNFTLSTPGHYALQPDCPTD